MDAKQRYIKEEVKKGVIELFKTKPKLHYTGCPRRNVPDFGRMFLKLKYTDITQNTYIRS